MIRCNDPNIFIRYRGGKRKNIQILERENTARSQGVFTSYKFPIPLQLLDIVLYLDFFVYIEE